MSSNPVENNHLWEFGEFRVDARARLVLKDGIPVPLTPKAFDVLVYLLRNRDRAVSREELLQAIWPDTVVTDASLTQAVFLVRKALGETESSRYVETLPRIGYRMTLPSQPPAPDADRAPSAPPAPVPGIPAASLPARRRLALLAVAALAAAVVVWLVSRKSPEDGDVSTGPGGAPPLLALEREIAVPPDTLGILGSVDGTIVLSAPGAFYLLPADGALAASRVPLGEGEVAAARLAGGRLVLVRSGRVVSRDPAKPGETDLGPLPARAPGAMEGRLLVSRSGRFLLLRTEAALEIWERAEPAWTLRLGVDVPFLEGEVVELSERFVALAQGRATNVRMWSLPDGASVLDTPFPERQVFALGIDDARGQLAVGGPFDSVAVFAASGTAPARRIPRRGWTHGLAWVGDVPTLLASGQAGLAAFRLDVPAGNELADSSPAGALLFDSDFLLALVPRRHRLAIVRYSGFAPSARVVAGGKPLWAVEHDADGKTVFAGGRDGHLWVLDTTALSVTSQDVHTDGIPSLAREGDLLASSSDDKTVAVWQLPGPKLLLRSKAHDFLVNDVAVGGSGGARELVTSSSDGTVKRWTWPGLEPIESIDVAALLGGPVSFHAVHVPDGSARILAGTWDSRLLDLTRLPDRWNVRAFPVRSRAVYRFAALPRLGLVLAVGILPGSLHLFDLFSSTLHEVDAAGLDAMWAVRVPGRDEVVVVGLDGVSRYAFSAVSPDAPGRRVVTYRAWSRRLTGAGLQTATLLPDGTIWSGTLKGELVRTSLSDLDGEPVLTRSLSLPAR